MLSNGVIWGPIDSEISLRVASLIIVVSALAGCGSGSSSPSNEFVPPAVRIVSPGGLWVGVDSDGQDVIALVSEDSFFYFLDGRFETGSGLLTVINEESVHGNFQPPPEPGFVFQDENLNRDCKLTGSIAEREFMTLDVQCRTEENQQVFTTLDLNYDIRYERNSALATIAGDYGFTAGMVLSVDTLGSIFGQDSVSGVVINGQIAVLDSSFNLYAIEWSEICCVGQDTELIVKIFSGLALLDNTVIPEQLIYAVSSSSENGSTYSSFVNFVERL